MAREIALFEDGKEYYRGKLGVNECVLRGRIFKDIQRATGRGPTKFTMTLSNGKKKDSDEWLPSTFVNCLAWQELGQQIADRYADKDEIELIARYSPHSYNKVTYPEFVVREIICMKAAESDNPYPSGDEPAKDSDDLNEIPIDEDDPLPF